MNATQVLFAIAIIIATACDAPQRTRLIPNSVNNDSNYTYVPNSGNSNFSQDNGSNENNNSSNSTTGFENCDLTNNYHTIDIGYFGLCQNTSDETLFKFKPSITSNNYRTCLIPTYKDSAGASTYIGNPQCTFTTSNVTIQGKLFKDRPGFGSYPINGVIVMREPLLPEYIGCMHAYLNWPVNACPGGANSSPYCNNWVSQCPAGPNSNPNCNQEARNYMSVVCNNFKTQYANSYIDIRTR